ncbi:MAG: A/G-specific adenine glycosylase [Acidobacteria bacterium]|nr:A/G-specific adenine glycosylase [Acidobacteriota bacterium]
MAPRAISQHAEHQVNAIRQALLRWYDPHRRGLPWRKARDPYRIWISEVMLQQTRALTVIPYYEKFLNRFPDVQTLAAADESNLLACWSGLGYYSRARNLRKAARMIVRDHGGCFPRDLQAALELPGVGDYTARAVLSIAYAIPFPVLDGNVARVLSRLYARRADLRSTSGKRKLLNMAESLLSRRRPGDFNQALMELGATVCAPRQPQCSVCPLRKYCKAYSRDQMDRYPPTHSKVSTKLRSFLAVHIRDGQGKCLLARRPPEENWMGGFWELPMWELDNKETNTRARHNRKDGIILREFLGRLRHRITTNQIEVAFYQGYLARPPISPQEKWVSLDQIERMPITTITRKVLSYGPKLFR